MHEHKDDDSFGKPARILPHVEFSNQKPILVDDLFQELEMVDIVPGIQSPYESYVVKVAKGLLRVGHVVAVFLDPEMERLFDLFELYAVAVVVEQSPLIMTTIVLDPAARQVLVPNALPKNITIFAVEFVFVFNLFGVSVLPAVLLDRTPINMVGFRDKLIRQPSPLTGLTQMSTLTQALPVVASTPTDVSHKARQNAVDCQNIKVLFLQNAYRFREFAGTMENLGADQVLASVQRLVPLSLLKLVALLPINVKKFLMLNFQLLVPVNRELAKPIVALHLTHFNFPNTNVFSFLQVRACFERFTQVLCAIVAWGGSGCFLDGVFAPLLLMLHSCAERSLSKLDPMVVLHELSRRLVMFSQVLASDSALTQSEVWITSQLKQALIIDEDSLLKQNFWMLQEKMTRKMAFGFVESGEQQRDKKPRSSGREFGDFAVRGGGDAGKWSGRGSRAHFCILEACYKYLEAGKMYDGRPLGPCIHGKLCKFEHRIPNAPVTASQKAELVSLVRFVPSEKRAALEKVMAKPTFGG